MYEDCRLNLVPELGLFAEREPGQANAFLHAVVGVAAKVASNGLEHAAANVVLEPTAHLLQVHGVSVHAHTEALGLMRGAQCATQALGW